MDSQRQAVRSQVWSGKFRGEFAYRAKHAAVASKNGAAITAWPSDEPFQMPPVDPRQGHADLLPTPPPSRQSTLARDRDERQDGEFEYIGQDAATASRNGAWITAWPADEACNLPSLDDSKKTELPPTPPLTATSTPHSKCL
ncbi:hypothetical protein MKZ38_006410 [Zalerion maritima]|uniref:Uncharacterized protein n=1 Tax=Zalerion maritima TaxID=339359 RepID=A0AAD5RIV8_9PEZI|nr:hypothetical protein MKZ38_006410 [Zalerion maritima]